MILITHSLKSYRYSYPVVIGSKTSLMCQNLEKVQKLLSQNNLLFFLVVYQSFRNNAFSLQQTARQFNCALLNFIGSGILHKHY